MEEESLRERSVPRTCLSKGQHNDRVRDVALHYFGCLKGSEKAMYFASLPAKYKKRIQDEKERITRSRAYFEAHPESENGVNLINFTNSLKEYRKTHRRINPLDGQPWRGVFNKEEIVDEQIKASMIYFKEGRPFTVAGIGSKFPNQKISVRGLLAEEEGNPLIKPCPENMIRYFHLPANNMLWVEEAMARYYHEKRPESDELLVKSRIQDRTKAEMLLRPEFWRGQQHGDGNAAVHARHMRSLCDVVPNVSSEAAPKNLVLFMHYLQWETDRAHTRSTKVIKEASTRQSTSVGEITDRVVRGREKNRKAVLENLKPKTPLGQILLLGAALYEAMVSQADEQLIHEYLDENPPLHPRRTLDQSFYGALKNTQTRDRDQVVYRGTAPAPHKCPEDPVGAICQDCQMDFKKVPRIVMVDQLWMWILDEKTIITSFPRRWGKNKPDPSAVHKSIRVRLQSARDGEMRSVFDLALIIVDQCSRVFFDRSKPMDRAPNLVDIFADAIRGVTYKQTAAFDQFLTYAHLASKDYGVRDESGTTAMKKALLNINSEGKLLKEIKDILDELHIIIRIKIQERVVTEAFVKHIRSIMLPRATQVGYLKTRKTSPGDDEEQLEAVQCTLARADSLLSDIEKMIAELNALEDAARDAGTALKDVLTLKQQQASVIMGQESMKQGIETLKQGRSIMLFTVITIVFLPLSFFATVFGMNTYELNGSFMHLHQQFYYMFPISLFIVLSSILFAFSSSSLFSSIFSLLLALVSYAFNIFSTYIYTKSGLYSLSRDLSQKAVWLRDKERDKTGSMKAEVLKEKMEEGGFREMRRAVGNTELGKGVGKLGKGATGAGLKIGKRVWRLGKSSRSERRDSVDVESQGTGSDVRLANIGAVE